MYSLFFVASERLFDKFGVRVRSQFYVAYMSFTHGYVK